MQTKPHKAARTSKWKKILLWVGIIIILGLTAGYIYLKSVTYQPSFIAQAGLQSDSKVTVTEVKGGYKFEYADGPVKEPNIIFYPGGLVEPVSYSPLARELAEAGHRVFIADMPLNLAIFGENKADSFVSQYPEEAFVIGGHSLGGVFASRYAAAHADKLQGVFFLASYADEQAAIRDTELSVLQITGTNDAVLNREVWESSRVNLPEDTIYVEIDGGNHGQFGSYGMQQGDQQPAISGEQQIEETAAAIQDWIAQLDQDQ
ncbi:alpha/beta hydrolase [Paenibacillus sambharensis]|uniref:Alpha/beta hydrolase n=1 Tax=Paenibacillus sambharensis TaxID=1803190 RepID=A0A2W1LEE6_9BACL|nr:alpha/beta hydrolase [Paenibacillus sambharensis]PZD97183.1 alpha/beta hydrolase [Paenibacillus sambharensis]